MAEDNQQQDSQQQGNQQAEGTGILQDIGSLLNKIVYNIKRWLSSLGSDNNNPPTPPETPAAPGDRITQDGDALALEMMSPLRGQDVIKGNIADTDATVGYVPTVYKVNADTAQTATADIIAEIKNSIIKGSKSELNAQGIDQPLDHLIISGDGNTNIIAVSEPNAQGTGSVPGVNHKLFESVNTEEVLSELYNLQQQEFEGHPAGAPLSKSLLFMACDVVSQEDKTDGAFYFEAAKALGMPIIASASTVYFNVGGAPAPVEGDFIQFNPDGKTWSFPSIASQPPANLEKQEGENPQVNMAWLKDFLEKNPTSPVPPDDMGKAVSAETKPVAGASAPKFADKITASREAQAAVAQQAQGRA